MPSACPPVLATTGTAKELGEAPDSRGKCGTVATIPVEAKLPNEGSIVITRDAALDVATVEPAYFTSTTTVAVRSVVVENHEAATLTEHVPTPLAACSDPHAALWARELPPSWVTLMFAEKPVAKTRDRLTESKTWNDTSAVLLS